MSRLVAFLATSLDGYYEGAEPWSIDWHNVDEEFNDFAVRQLDGAGALVFGRATYLGMAGYWPSEAGVEDDPDVAQRMNTMQKIVVSRTLEPEEIAWANTRLLRDPRELASVRDEAEKEILVLGSSVLTSSLIQLGLLDQLRILVNPILLGSGNSLASSLEARVRLRLLDTRRFGNGNVLLTYEPEG